MGAVLDARWVRDPLRRRGALAVVVIILALLSVWPRHYLARAQLLPDDSGGGIASLLSTASGGAGGLLSLGALIGNHQSIETDLTIGRSQAVLSDVIRRWRLADRLGNGDIARAEIALRRKVDIEAVRGSILQITVQDRDPDVAVALVADFVLAIRGRLATISLGQSAQKKLIAVNRFGAAAVNLAKAQAAIDQFRAANRLAVPEIQLGAAVSLVTALQAKLHADQAALQTLRQFATGDNIQVQAAQAEVGALQGQILAAEASARNAPGPSVGGMTPQISEYENLFRNEKYAEAEYEIYKRYSDTVAAEELSAGINMDVIEPPYVSPERQYNTAAVGALILTLILAVLAEFYIAQPPVGRR